MKFSYLPAVFLSLAPISLMAITQAEKEAFVRIAHLALQERDTFCQKGYSTYIKSIRSQSGDLCKDPLPAALAVRVCEGFEGFATSQCLTSAGRAGFTDRPSITKVFSSLSLNSESEAFKELCKTVTDILPKKKGDCDNIQENLAKGVYARLAPAKPKKETPAEPSKVVKPLMEVTPPPGAAPSATGIGLIAVPGQLRTYEYSLDMWGPCLSSKQADGSPVQGSRTSSNVTPTADECEDLWKTYKDSHINDEKCGHIYLDPRIKTFTATGHICRVTKK